MCASNILTFLNAEKMFTIIHEGEQIKSAGKKVNNTIELSKKVVCHDKIIEDDTQNEYYVTSVSRKPPMYPGISAHLSYIAHISVYNHSSSTNIHDINNSIIIVNSNVQAEIALLPKEVQPIAQELFQTLIEYLNKKIKPKNFKERFGDFIQKYGNSIASLGGLGLQILLTLL